MLGLLAWLYLLAQLTLYAVEVNVVAAKRLWPRSLAPPPLTKEDRRAYRMYARIQERRQEQDIESHIHEDREQPPAGSHPQPPAAAKSTPACCCSARLRLRRSRCGPTVYFGSRAEARPASKTPNRVSADEATSAAPASRGQRVRLRPASAAPASPAAVSTSAASISVPAGPCW